jgi:hypothetical protein
MEKNDNILQVLNSLTSTDFSDIRWKLQNGATTLKIKELYFNVTYNGAFCFSIKLVGKGQRKEFAYYYRKSAFEQLYSVKKALNNIRKKNTFEIENRMRENSNLC